MMWSDADLGGNNGTGLEAYLKANEASLSASTHINITFLVYLIKSHRKEMKLSSIGI